MSNFSYTCGKNGTNGIWLPSIPFVAGCIAKSPQRKVFEFLLKKLVQSNYSSLLRPKMEYTEQVEVTVTVEVNSIRSLDTKGVLLSLATIDLRWTDDYLNWETIEHIEFYRKFKVQIPKSYLWVPEIVVWNSAGDKQSLQLQNNSILRVSTMGEVRAKISTILDTNCDMKLLKFPFDLQTCPLILIFPDYNENEVRWKIGGRLLDQEGESGENPLWKVKNTTIKTSRYQSRQEEEYKSLLNYTITLKRDPGTAIIYIILPTISISTFNLISLLLPSGQDGKVSMSTTIFLSFVMLQALISTILPTDTAEMPVLIIFIIGSLISSAINVCISCSLMWMVHGKYHISEGLRLWIVKYFGKLRLPLKISEESAAIEKMLGLFRKSIVQSITPVTSKTKGAIKSSDIKQMHKNSVGMLIQGLNQAAFRIITENPQQGRNPESSECPNENPSFGLDSNARMLESLKAVQKDLHYLVLETMLQKFNPEDIAKEQWKELAVIVNRISGIILSIANIGLAVYTGLVMLTLYNGFF